MGLSVKFQGQRSNIMGEQGQTLSAQESRERRGRLNANLPPSASTPTKGQGTMPVIRLAGKSMF